MKTFIVTFQTNYDLGVAIINATSLEIAREIAIKNEYIWDGFSITELDRETECQILEY